MTTPWSIEFDEMISITDVLKKWLVCQMVQAVNSLWCLRVEYEFLEEEKTVYDNVYCSNIISDHIIRNQSAKDSSIQPFNLILKNRI